MAPYNSPFPFYLDYNRSHQTKTRPKNNISSPTQIKTIVSVFSYPFDRMLAFFCRCPGNILYNLPEEITEFQRPQVVSTNDSVIRHSQKTFCCSKGSRYLSWKAGLLLKGTFYFISLYSFGDAKCLVNRSTLNEN